MQIDFKSKFSTKRLIFMMQTLLLIDIVLGFENQNILNKMSIYTYITLKMRISCFVIF